MESQESLKRILSQALLSSDRNCTQKPIQLLCPWGRVPGKMRKLCPGEGAMLMEMMLQSIITAPCWEAGVLLAKPSGLLGLCSASICCVVSLLQWVRCPGNKHTEHCQLDKEFEKQSLSNLEGLASRITELPNYGIFISWQKKASSIIYWAPSLLSTFFRLTLLIGLPDTYTIVCAFVASFGGLKMEYEE